MKKITIGLMLLFAIGTAVKAQDYKKVREALTLAQVPGTAGQAKLEDAKAQLDKVLADPKADGKAETYLLKTEVYGTIAGNEALKAKYPNADAEAFQALKKYLELEPGEEKIKEDKYAGVNSAYSSLFICFSIYLIIIHCLPKYHLIFHFQKNFLHYQRGY